MNMKIGKSSTKRLVIGGVLLATSVLLPVILHGMGVSAMGEMLLPMHIPVLFAGLLIGPYYGLAIGMLAPIINFLLLGMPGMPRVIFMIFELGAYGLCSGILAWRWPWIRKHTRVIPTLLASMVFGRGIYALIVLLCNYIPGLLGGATIAPLGMVWYSTVTGISGIMLQLLLIPSLLYAFKKGELLDGLFGNSQSGTLS